MATAQGILGISTKDKSGNYTFTNKYIQEDTTAYSERIGQIASFLKIIIINLWDYQHHKQEKHVKNLHHNVKYAYHVQFTKKTPQK